jgi:hypothetical protein
VVIVVKLVAVDWQQHLHWHLTLQPEPQPSVGEIVTPPSRYRAQCRAAPAQIDYCIICPYLPAVWKMAAIGSSKAIVDEAHDQLIN